jgi:Ca-activated chloride channel family protein
VRLTSDPNAFFFFLDHLGQAPPFRLEDDTSWDTNIEDGIFWGIKMIEVDEKLYGRRRSAKAFVVISDGQAWSGEVGKAIELARSLDIRVYVIGVGTSAGGIIPDMPPRRYEPEPPRIHSSLDRQSLRAIADAGGGQYYELGTQSDQLVALQVLNDAQQYAQRTHREDVVEELYWALLLAAAGFVCLGTLVMRERAQLWWHLASAVTLLVAMMAVV